MMENSRSYLDGEVGPAISMRGVNHFYGSRQALKDVTFAVASGRFTVLLGLNGAGKTTLFSLLSRLYSHQSGAIELCSFDIAKRPSEALRRLGIVFQSRTLDLDLSLVQNLHYHASLQGMRRKDATVLIEALLRSVELFDRAQDKARSLSGGQMRRVEIARALLHRPRVLLLDEATVGLDINSRASILKLIRQLVVSEGISVLWATHLIDEVDHSDDLLILHHGELLASGSVPEILKSTSTGDVQQAFLTLTSAVQNAGKDFVA
jgi:ABC-2 type transport system ATP-binding protein